MKRIGFITIFLTSIIFYSTAEVLTGKDIVNFNNTVEISGELKYMDSEQFVLSDEVLYQLHLGPEEYAKEIGFNKEFKGIITIFAYIHDKHLAPIKLLYNNTVYEFWGNDGRPMWRGKSYTGGSGNGDHE